MLHLTVMSLACFSLKWVFSLCGTLMTSRLLKITGYFWGEDPSAGVFLWSPLDWPWSWVFGRNNMDRSHIILLGGGVLEDDVHTNLPGFQLGLSTEKGLR